MLGAVDACTKFSSFFSDSCLFPLSQTALVVFVLFAFCCDLVRRYKTKEGFNGTVKRGEKAMGRFYAAYGVLTTIFVTICVSSDAARYYRVFYVFFDIILIGYVCLLNVWFRTRLISWSNALPKWEFR